MICPECHTPNPEGVTTCLQCSGGLSDPALTARRSRQRVHADARLSDQPEGPDAAASSPTRRPPRRRCPPGFEIGKRYRVLRILGRGGMGAVYHVQDRQLDREVALKLIRADIAENHDRARALQARDPALEQGHAQERPARLRPRRVGRRPVPDDALHRGRGPRRAHEARETAVHSAHAPRSSARSARGSRPRTSRGSSTAT